MKFNKKILKEYGITNFKNNELIEIMHTKINYLITHNKNYTKSQYYELIDLAELVSAIE